MTLLLGAFTIGLLLGLVALSTFVSYRIFNTADITVDGSLPLGGAVAAILLTSGVNPILATAAGGLAGALAGAVTGSLSMKCHINPLLSGILTMTALYSVNLRVMGKSNISLHQVPSLATLCESRGVSFFGAKDVNFLGWMISSRDIVFLGLSLAAVLLTTLALHAFFRTNLGILMRAMGDNPVAARALGGSQEWLHIMGLCLANALAGLSGALLVQYQGFADVQMGIGTILIGFAAVIIGEAFSDPRRLGLALAGALLGSVLFRLIVAILLRWGLNPNDLKLMTAVFVLVALGVPRVIKVLTGRRKAA